MTKMTLKIITDSKFRSYHKNNAYQYPFNDSYYVNWSCFETITALELLLDNIFVRYRDSVYCQVIGIPMETTCAPLIAVMFLYCNELQFMTKISKDTSKQHLIQKFNNTFRYLDDILAFNNDYFSMYTMNWL